MPRPVWSRTGVAGAALAGAGLALVVLTGTREADGEVSDTPAADTPAAAAAALPADAARHESTPAPRTRRTAPARAALRVEVRSRGSTLAVAGITVALQARSSRTERRDATDARGRVAWHDLAPGRYRCTVGTHVEAVDLRHAPHRASIVIELAGQLVTGRVVEAGSDRPVAGARIWTLRCTDPRQRAFERRAVARSDVRGGFTIWLPSRLHELAAAKAGYATSARHVVRTMTHRAPGELFCRIELTPGGVTLAGRVTDTRGAACSGAAVTLRRLVIRPRYVANAPLLPFPSWRAATDGSGEFAFTGLEPGARVELQVRHGDLVPERAVIALTAEAVRHDVVLAGGSIVTGTVSDAERGVPIAGAEVRCRRHDGVVVKTRAGSDGSYRLAGLTSEPQRVVELRLTGTHGPLPVPRETRGGFTIRARHPGFQETVTTVSESRARTVRVDLELARGVRMHGFVRTAAGAPLAGWSVRGTGSRADTATGVLEPHVWRTETGRDGSFEVTGCYRSVYTVACHPPPPALTAPVVRVRVQQSRIASLIELRVPDERMPSADIRGIVVGPGGAPPAWCHALLESTETLWHQGFDLHGSSELAIGPLPPGPYRLTLQANAGKRGHVVPVAALRPFERRDLGLLRLPAAAR